MLTILQDIPADRPVLIAGPTASGKSSLALEIAARDGGKIINADALQVFENWRLLSARPSPEEETAAPHHLYGHVPFDGAYSVGHWLREVTPLLEGQRPIIVGGTGLNFRALTEGLADIPPTPVAIRAQANARISAEGIASLLAELDGETATRIDQNNPMRIQRAWEVLKATGRPLAQWQDETPAPTLALEAAFAIVMDAPKDWLNARIETRFDLMLRDGALDEARANLPRWNPDHLSSRAIGAPELIAHLRGEIDLQTARERAITASRQYAKRQRTWFRARMKSWRAVDPSL